MRIFLCIIFQCLILLSYGQNLSCFSFDELKIDTAVINALNRCVSENLDTTSFLLNYSDTIVLLSEQINYSKGKGAALVNMAGVHKKRFNHYESIKLYKKAIVLFLQANDSLDFIETKYNLAFAYFMTDSFPSALKIYFEILPILSRYNKKEIESDALLDIGRVYFYGGNPDKSMEWYVQALKIAENLNDLIRMAKIYSWIGYAYTQKKNDSLSLHYHKKALETAQKVNHKKSIGTYMSSVGDSYIQLKNFSEALKYILSASEIFVELNYLEGYAWTLMSSATCYIQKLDYDKAIKNLTKSEDISRKIKAKYISRLATEKLYLVYKELGNDKLALNYLERTMLYRDTLMNEGKLTQIAEIQTKFDIEMLEHEKLLLTAKVDLQQQELKVHYYQSRILMIIILLMIITVLSVLYILKMRTKNLKQKSELFLQQCLLREKENAIEKAQNELIEVELRNSKLESEKLKSELKFKNQELINFALRITEKNDLLDKIKIEIKFLQKQYEPLKLKDLYTSVNHNLQLDSDREKFHLSIDEVHQSFFLKLEQKFPDLTKSEKRLLALLVMDLSSKEIAGIINISPASVNTKRYRLRKKMNLETDESLIDFLKKL